VLAATRGSSVLPVERAEAPAWLVRLHAIPLLGALLPLPRALPLFTPMRVTVRLEPLPAASCGRDTCYRARLLTAVAAPVPHSVGKVIASSLLDR
jgi:hypothetical protein